MSPALYRPTWAEVDLRLLRANLLRFRRKMPRRTAVLFVVKAGAYGHGAVECARTAEGCGAVRWLGVSSVEEGIGLREAGIRLPILILGSLYPFESMVAAIRHGLTPTVASLDGARRIAHAAAALKRIGRGGNEPRLACHLKVDTGMGRIGVRWPSGRQVADYLRGAKGVLLEGVYTHLACAETDPAFTRRQLEIFRGAIREIESSGARVPLRHAANSAAALRWPGSRWDMVRPGLAAYGLYGEGFKPVLSLKTRIVFLKSVGPGTPIGYGARYRTRGRARIATLPVGYGDGLPRLISVGPGPRACVLVRGRRCPMVGAMSMDMTTVDVTGVEGVHVGEEAVLIGRSGREDIRASELAEAALTIPYEILTGLTSRVPRMYPR